MTTTQNTPAALRRLAKVCGLKNVRIRKDGNLINVFPAIDATREDKIRMVAFLISVNAEIRECDGRALDLSTINPLHVSGLRVARFGR